jgi:hypothetical protein
VLAVGDGRHEADRWTSRRSCARLRRSERPFAKTAQDSSGRRGAIPHLPGTDTNAERAIRSAKPVIMMRDSPVWRARATSWLRLRVIPLDVRRKLPFEAA